MKISSLNLFVALTKSQRKNKTAWNVFSREKTLLEKIRLPPAVVFTGYESVSYY
jgi:hypothetical protein